MKGRHVSITDDAGGDLPWSVVYFLDGRWLKTCGHPTEAEARREADDFLSCREAVGENQFVVLEIFAHKVPCSWHDFSDTDRNGDYIGEPRKIRICKTQKGNQDSVREILIHECVHCVSAHMNLEIDEDTTMRLGQGLAQMLKPYMGDVE